MEMTFRASAWRRLTPTVMLAIAFFSFTSGSLSIMSSSRREMALVPSHPSIVRIGGTQLIVQKRRPDNTLENPQPYTIRGVNWSPASKCTSQSQLPGEFEKWYQTDLPLMAAMGVNTIRTLWDLGVELASTQILDELYENGIMVIMTVDQTIANWDTITTTVNAYKNHPAVLLWAVGNEWDLNHYYGRLTDTVQSAAFTEAAAQAIHGLDSNHPVASILADIARDSQPLLPIPWSPSTLSTRQIVNELVPSVDIWGVNIYRGAILGGLFAEWRQISTKPMFLGEFGADSYDHRISNENQLMQADFDAALWSELCLNLSADRPGRPSPGGLVFEWNDEWWKNGSPCTQDVSEETNYGQPDLHNDEEWFGVVDIDRRPKQAYYRMRECFLGRSITVTTQVTVSVFSEGHSQFFKNGAGFYDTTQGEGGRGLNFAIIDPNTGAIEDTRSFDTWYDHQAFVTMANFVSETIPSGSLVLVAIADEGGFIRYAPPQSDCHSPWDDWRVEMGYQALQSLGSKVIRNVGYWGSWAMVTIKGQEALAEAYHDPLYAPPVGGFCQLQSRVSTQITATTPISVVLPAGFRVNLPSILHSAHSPIDH